MNTNYLIRLINDKDLIKQKIEEYEHDKIIIKLKKDENEIKGHVEKAEHNLNFIKDNLKLGYNDWCITGCYYAVYQAALALIQDKGYYSKNHDATLCVLIKEYFKELKPEEIELINKFYLEYQDLLIYVQSKNKRDDASYSSSYKYSNDLVNELRLKAIVFVNKAKEILNL